MKFKVGDWVRHIKNPLIIQHVKSLDEEEKTFECDWSWASSE